MKTVGGQKDSRQAKVFLVRDSRMNEGPINVIKLYDNTSWKSFVREKNILTSLGISGAPGFPRLISIRQNDE